MLVINKIALFQITYYASCANQLELFIIGIGSKKGSIFLMGLSLLR